MLKQSLTKPTGAHTVCLHAPPRMPITDTAKGTTSPAAPTVGATKSSTIMKERYVKKLLISVATTALLIAAYPATAAWQGNGGRIDARQHNQQARIADGVRSGDLTHREARGLRNEQRAIRRVEHRYRSDGMLTGGERRALHSDLNRASRHIYNQRHDYERRRPHAAARYDRPWHHRDTNWRHGWHDHRFHDRHHGRHYSPWRRY